MAEERTIGTLCTKSLNLPEISIIKPPLIPNDHADRYKNCDARKVKTKIRFVAFGKKRRSPLQKRRKKLQLTAQAPNTPWHSSLRFFRPGHIAHDFYNLTAADFGVRLDETARLRAEDGLRRLNQHGILGLRVTCCLRECFERAQGILPMSIHNQVVSTCRVVPSRPCKTKGQYR